MGLSWRLDRLDATAWRYIFLESAHDTKGKGRGLIDVISSPKLQQRIKEAIELVANMCDKVRQIDKLEMSLKDLGQTVNGFLHCVVSVRYYCRYLTTSSERNSLSKKELARLKKKADTLLPGFKREI